MLINFPNNFIIYDLEYTAWEGSKKRNWGNFSEHKEIIEIGAILVNHDFEEVGSFSKLIIPNKNPILSDYIVNLTGITNKMLSNKGVIFKQGYLEFLNFINKHANIAFAYGDDRNVLLANLKMNHMNHMNHMNNNIIFKNIRPYIEHQLNIFENSIDSSALNTYLGIKKTGNAHRAIDDCRAILNGLVYTNQYLETKD